MFSLFRFHFLMLSALFLGSTNSASAYDFQKVKNFLNKNQNKLVVAGYASLLYATWDNVATRMFLLGVGYGGAGTWVHYNQHELNTSRKRTIARCVRTKEYVLDKLYWSRKPLRIVDWKAIDEKLKETYKKEMGKIFGSALHMVEENNKVTKILTRGNQFRGFIMYGRRNADLYIDLLGVKEGFQKSGYGKLLLQDAITYAKTQSNIKKVELYSVQSAIGFYQKFGFKRVKNNHMELAITNNNRRTGSAGKLM